MRDSVVDALCGVDEWLHKHDTPRWFQRWFCGFVDRVCVPGRTHE